MSALIEAARDLAEAVESMQATFGCIQGKTPEDDDLHIHDKWAEEFIAERLATLRNALAAAEAQPKPMTTMGEHFIGVIAGIWRDNPDYSIRQTLDALNAKWPSSQPVGEPVAPMFWVRLCSDGLYEGPIHNARIEEVRQQSGAWSPLYLGASPAQPAAQPLTDEVVRDMLADTREVFDANGPETSQEVRDVIEYVSSWLRVYIDKPRAHGIGSQP